ncbi:MAG: PEP-CTERM system TPR-repeat protein PrsT [gamma proteobacterium symbiont of Bathyaustriella thionipta]|nr:PEP-CTERM system TPR-repeat protein PrsT [gamma proteobacterium symbiont of Bathyaustriella thionipta]MCU7948658.1 PEP-CTERM system TPR-repeat protein PrsT [gamma proteobacterium symbiont of Bathyaustriella thionipta]MCU7953704.1 PEP-CTERM system TPR-repeat protein PrsT [gamma proteobacterium symbiont of Bathyaustriella thionipta]MCU7955189.1 PEP-CTERM system TPR-repeat protein PrsT [gamma proteobacterium symbiont of Bathyaustriella thionipta]MCU7967084.1 PEP-CTERM system TPR-repeat protein 
MTKKLLLISILAGFNMTVFSTVMADNLQDAKQAIEKNEYPAAIIHLKNQLKESPKDEQARFLLGSTYLKTGKLDSSLKELGRAHSLAPENTDILFTYVEVLQASGKQKKILEILKTPLAENQLEYKRLNYQGNAHLSLKQLADAKALFEQANQLKESAMAYNGLATLAIIEQDFPVAEQLLDKSLAIEAENAATLQISAKLANLKKQPETALKLYNQLIESNPKNLSFRLERAATLTILKDFEPARADLEMILDKVNNHPQANFIKAQILLQERDYAAAQEAAQQVVNVAPQHMPAAFILGTANFALKNYNQAEEYLTIYLASNPGNLKAQNVLANVYLAQKKAQQSILILEGIPEKQLETDPLLMMTLGTSYIQIGDTQKGVQILTHAQSLAPDNQDIRKRLIAAQFQSGELNDAISELEQLASMQNDSTQTQTQTQTNYLLIITYIKQQQFDKAEEKVRQLLNQSPDDNKLLNLQALIVQLQGDSEKSIALYQAIIKKDKENIPAYMGLARIYSIESKWQEAEQSFKEVIKINPRTLKAYLGLAAIAEKQNQPEIAEIYFLDAMEQSQNNISSTLTIAGLLSQWYQTKQQPEKVLKLAEKLEQKNPNNNDIRSFLARAQLLNKQTERSERTLKTIITYDKNDTKHRILLAQIIAKDTQRASEALALLNEAQVIQPDNLSIYTLKASLFINQKNYDDAIKVAKRMQEQFPDNNTGKLLEADIIRNQKQYEKALLIYQAVYQQQADKQILAAIVDILLILNQKDKAIEVLTEAHTNTLDGMNDIDNLFKLASLHQEKQQLKQAEDYYQLLLKQNPKHVITLNNLAWIKIESDVKEAVKLAKTAYEQAPESGAIMDTYGYFLVMDGQYAEGIELLKQAATQLPDDKDIQYHLAFAYEKTGDRENAQSILKNIIDTDDEFLEKKKAQQLYDNIK